MLTKKSITMKKVTVIIMSMIMNTNITMTMTMIMAMMRTGAQAMEFSTTPSMSSTFTKCVKQRIKLLVEMEETGPKKTRGSIFSESTKM